MSKGRLRAEQKVAAVLRGERRRFDYVQATVPYHANAAAVAGRAGWINVWLHGDPDNEIEVFNPSTPIASGIVVDLERIPIAGAPYYRVVGIAANIWYNDSFGYTQYYSSGITGNVGSHAPQHERRDFGVGGFDPLDVYTRMFVPLRARAQTTPDMTVNVGAGYYKGNVFKRFAGGNSPTFTTPAPSAPARYDLLYLGSDDALHILQGTAATYGLTPGFPHVPSGALPIAFVYLTSNTVQITESHIIDARVVLDANMSASGTGDASADAPYALTYSFSGLPSGVVIATGILMRGALAQRPSSNVVEHARFYVTGVGVARDTHWHVGAWENVTDNNLLQTGVARGNRHRINFSGSGVNVWDDPANEWLNVDINPSVPSGAAGGDLTDTYPNPTVAKLRGTLLGAMIASAGVGSGIVWDGARWNPSGVIRHQDNLGGDVSGTPFQLSVVRLRGRSVANTAPSHGQALAWDSAGDQWLPTTTGVGGSGSPVGAAGGDLSGTYPNPTVAKLQGRAVSSGAPSHGQALAWDSAGNQWLPTTTGVGGGGSADLVQVASNAGSVRIPSLAASADISGGAPTGGLDYEFDNTTDPFTWTASAPNTHDANTTIKSHLYLKTTDNTYREGYVSWSPIGELDARTKIMIGSESASALTEFYFSIKNSDGSKRAEMYLRVNGTSFVQYQAWTKNTTYAQRGSTVSAQVNEVYFRITRDGSDNWSFFYSHNGLLWVPIAINVNLAITVSHIGFGFGNNSSINGYAACDWLRTSV